MTTSSKKDETVRVPQQVLRAFAETAFQRLNVPEDDAKRAANTLIESDLRGIDSHGISRLDRFYLQGLEGGRINAKANWRVMQESPTTARIDADSGLGLMVGTHAMEIAVAKAREYGCGFVTVANSRHFGASGVYATQALEHDMIGISMTNTGPIVVPAGGLDPRLGTNPIAVAVPVADGDPFILDMATSAVSAGKFETYRRMGKNPPPGWAQDEQGNPILDNTVALGSRRIIPLGSDLEHSSYKGYGLAIVVDVLCGILSGMGPGLWLGGQPGAFQSAHFFGAWRIDAFSDPAWFKQTMHDYLNELRATPPMPGVDRVRVPGDIEAANKADRLKNGVPLYPDVIDNLRDVAQRLEIDLKL